MVINILSKSTYKADLSENVDICRNLKIPVYILFSPYKTTSKIYHPPFLRANILQENGSYIQKELHNTTLKEEEKIEKDNIIKINHDLPFRVGLMQIKEKHEGDQPRFRLIFIDKSENKILPTARQLAKEKYEKSVREVKMEAEEAKKEAEEAKKEAEEAKKEATKSEERADNLLAKLKQYKDRFGEL